MLKLPTIERLGWMLNPTKILTTFDGRPRDWRGLAEYAGLTGFEIEAVKAAEDRNYTRKIISLW